MENKPTIRFKEYKNEWRTLKLKEVCTFKCGSFPPDRQNKRWYGGENAMPFVKVGDVGDNMLLNKKTKTMISVECQKLCLFCPAGSIIATWKGTIGNVAITQFDCYVDSSILVFTPVDIDKNFLAFSLEKIFKSNIDKAQGTIKVLKENDVENFEIKIPNPEEQKKIADALVQVKNLIVSEQEMIEKLQEKKKFFLQNMFI